MPTLESGVAYQRTRGRRRLFFGRRSLLHPNYPECGRCNGEGWIMQPYGFDEATGHPTEAKIEDCPRCGGKGVAPASEAARGLVRLQ